MHGSSTAIESTADTWKDAILKPPVWSYKWEILVYKDQNIQPWSMQSPWKAWENLFHCPDVYDNFPEI